MAAEQVRATDATVAYYADLCGISEEDSVELCRPSILFEELNRGHLPIHEVRENPWTVHPMVDAASRYTRQFVKRLWEPNERIRLEHEGRFLSDSSERMVDGEVFVKKLIPRRIVTGRIMSLTIQAVAPEEMPVNIQPQGPSDVGVEWDPQRSLYFVIDGTARLGSVTGILACGILTSTAVHTYNNPRQPGADEQELRYVHTLEGISSTALLAWQATIMQARQQEAIERGTAFRG